MRNDYTTLSNSGRDLTHTIGDVLIRKTVETIASYALLVDFFRYREMIRQGAVVAVERGVEACDLRQFGPASQERSDRRKIVGLMQRRERYIALEFGDDICCQAHRAAVFRPAVNHAVTDRDKIDFLGFAQPVAGFLGCRRKVRHFFSRIGLVDQRFLVRPGSAQPRPGANSIHLTLDEAIEIAARAGREDLKLEARGASIDDENCVHGLHTAATAAFFRRASA